MSKTKGSRTMLSLLGKARPAAHGVDVATGRADESSVPAAWPSGVAGLARAVAAFQRCSEDESSAERLAPASQSDVLRPAAGSDTDAPTRGNTTKR